jgi:iron(II)-dependent oxidoreductase
MGQPQPDVSSYRRLPPTMVFIPGGEYRMGKDEGRKDEQPAHTVKVNPFHAAVAPVTNREYLAFVDGTGHAVPPFIHDVRFREAGQPVVGISWQDAVTYCAWLSSVAGRAFRLPTEAEREFAALGGLSSADWPWDGPTAEGHPEYQAIADAGRPHVPTQACANGYGLRCMAENVHEWCSDWYDAAYYQGSPVANPSGPAAGRRKVSRGGSWRHSVKFTRLTARASLDPHYRYNDFGFRVYAEARD